MKQLFAISFASVSIAIGAIPAPAEVDPKIHKLCIEAKDYAGCVRAQGGASKNKIDTSSCDKYLGTLGRAYLDCLSSIDMKGIPKRSFGITHESASDDVEIEHGFTYRKSSVKQLKIRGRYGRYLTFWGRSENEYQGTSASYNAGNPGTLNCYSNNSGSGYINNYSYSSNINYSSSGSTSCQRSGYVAPSYTPATPGGIQRGWFEYELDCIDRTFNRKGDRARGIVKKGWLDVYYDPPARAVADKYCQSINSLPKKS